MTWTDAGFVVEANLYFDQPPRPDGSEPFEVIALRHPQNVSGNPVSNPNDVSAFDNMAPRQTDESVEDGDDSMSVEEAEEMLGLVMKDEKHRLMVEIAEDHRAVMMMYFGDDAVDTFRVTMVEQTVRDLMTKSHRSCFNWKNRDKSLEICSQNGRWTLRFKMQSEPYSTVALDLDLEQTALFRSRLFDGIDVAAQAKV